MPLLFITVQREARPDARNSAHKAKFNLIPEIKLVENDGLKPNELKMAEMVIEENREIIIEQWHTFFGK